VNCRQMLCLILRAPVFSHPVALALTRTGSQDDAFLIQFIIESEMLRIINIWQWFLTDGVFLTLRQLLIDNIGLK
jgi:hypothetical protein